MADEKILAWPVKFKEPGSVIRLNGQEIHSGNLTEETYLWMMAWSKDFALQFVPAEKEEAKSKSKANGKAAESTGS